MRPYREVLEEFKQRRQEIAQEYTSGAHVADLVKKYGLSRERIRVILRQEGIKGKDAA